MELFQVYDKHLRPTNHNGKYSLCAAPIILTKYCSLKGRESNGSNGIEPSRKLFRIVKYIAGYDQISFVTVWINIQGPLVESVCEVKPES